MVRWGRHADRLDWIVSGRTNKIHKEEMCGGDATAQGWREPGLIHIANITGLVTMSLANQDIYYQVGDSADQSFSDIRKFHVPSLGGSQPPHRRQPDKDFDGRGSWLAWDSHSNSLKYGKKLAYQLIILLDRCRSTVHED